MGVPDLLHLGEASLYAEGQFTALVVILEDIPADQLGVAGHCVLLQDQLDAVLKIPYLQLFYVFLMLLDVNAWLD